MKIKQKAVVSLPCALVMLVLLVQSPAEANAGVPMLFFIWPASWMLLPIIIGIEAVVALKVLQADWKKAIKVSGIANVASSIVGIPLAWLVVLPVSFGGQFLYPESSGEIWKDIFVATVMSAWLPPLGHNDPMWIVYAAAAVLCIPCFFASVWIEYRIADKLTKKEHPELAIRWAWKANLWTYAAIIIALVVTAFLVKEPPV